jgi:hypothetical protein
VVEAELMVELELEVEVEVELVVEVEVELVVVAVSTSAAVAARTRSSRARTTSRKAVPRVDRSIPFCHLFNTSLSLLPFPHPCSLHLSTRHVGASATLEKINPGNPEKMDII